MKRLLIFTAATIVMMVSAFAHSPLKSTRPADGTELAKAPKSIELVFAKPARVTKVVLVHAKDGAKKEEKLVLPSKAFQKEFTLTPAFSNVGLYQVQWRALSEDGHVLKGSFKFSVQGE